MQIKPQHAHPSAIEHLFPSSLCPSARASRQWPSPDDGVNTLYSRRSQSPYLAVCRRPFGRNVRHAGLSRCRSGWRWRATRRARRRDGGGRRRGGWWGRIGDTRKTLRIVCGACGETFTRNQRHSSTHSHFAWYRRIPSRRLCHRSCTRAASVGCQRPQSEHTCHPIPPHCWYTDCCANAEQVNSSNQTVVSLKAIVLRSGRSVKAPQTDPGFYSITPLRPTSSSPKALAESWTPGTVSCTSEAGRRRCG